MNENWVRIMFDYCSSGLWEEGGANMDDSDIPITEDLKARIIAWHILYDKHSWQMQKMEGYGVKKQSLWLGDKIVRYKELEALCLADFLEGVRIAVEVKKQLPHWTVKVYNNYQGILMLPQDNRHNSEILLGWEPQFKDNLIY